MKDKFPSLIEIRGGREHNLKDVSLDIPRDSLTVITGISGSGKSSLAFDTVFKEGQRRYIESLSPYARQFLGNLDAPDVDRISGLSPTISIDQKTVNRNPRSTVGTITEIYDYYRLLYARLGEPHCHNCGELIRTQTPDQIVDALFADHADKVVVFFAPVVRERKGEYRKELQEFAASGFLRARIDGNLRKLDEEIVLARYEKHTIELVMDRVAIEEKHRSRITESVEKALQLAEGNLVVQVEKNDHLFNQHMACPSCQVSIPELEPRLFSFNAPQGACPACEGMGEVKRFTEEKLIHMDRSIADNPWKFTMEKGNIIYTRLELQHLLAACKAFGIDTHKPWKKLSQEERDLLLKGNDTIKLRSGLLFYNGTRIMHRIRESKKWVGIIPIMKFVNYFVKTVLEKFQEVSSCEMCGGERLNSTARSVLFHGRKINEIGNLTVEESLDFFIHLKLSEREEKIGKDIFREIRSRLAFLQQVGLDYLSLDRSAVTLSGGESQRIRLASQIGSGLQGVLYVLDEPSIGLHQSDNSKLIKTLKQLREGGNTILVVEHDEETMREADHLVDIGPGAGILGGEILYNGKPEEILNCKKSITAGYLSGDKRIPLPETRRKAEKGKIKIVGATRNNLEKLTVEFPLALFVCVTGVSGSGKSTLIDEVLRPALHSVLEKKPLPSTLRKIEGADVIDKVIEIDQSPIGRTSRSNPATYTKLWDPIRDLFAELPEARLRGYKKGRFSFNVKGGRCEACEGSGIKTIEMQFLANVVIPCEECNGMRFNEETLDIRFKGKNIFEVLELSVHLARSFFEHQPKILRILDTLHTIGLGYIKLGQSSTTLSGGEAQRIKLASHLRKRSTGKTLYLLDEPTTGLHFEDIRVLLESLHQLVDQGNSVIVIEHNLDVIKTADYVLDMGPGGGKHGGKIVAKGTPEKIATTKRSLTGQVLKSALNPGQAEFVWDAPASYQQDTRNIVVKGAAQNNLKNVSLSIPHNSITVVTGLSGSGKSSLVFDTIFAEGQSRYLESLSTYARRFLSRMDKPRVDRIDGLAPAIAIDQKNRSHSQRSNLATTTEIYDYLRLLFARAGTPHCPHCHVPLEQHTPTAAAKTISKEWNERQVIVAAPLYSSSQRLFTLFAKASDLEEQAPNLIKDGFARVLINGKLTRLEELTKKDFKLPKKITNIDLVIDRIVIATKNRKRLAEAMETAMQKGEGVCFVYEFKEKMGGRHTFSKIPACPQCHFSLHQELNPRDFSFNSHHGACPYCEGLGMGRLKKVCSSCDGQKLKPLYAAVTIQDFSITDLCRLTVEAANDFFLTLPRSAGLNNAIVSPIIRQIASMLKFLLDVGLGYLTLDRSAGTLSGGEYQRTRLASQLGTQLSGVIYVMDEPTIGMHQRDVGKLLATLRELKQFGNTILLVEHDEKTIRFADHIVDIGPGAGEHGGEVVATGSVEEIAQNLNSPTGRWLSNTRSIAVPVERRQSVANAAISIFGANANNLKNIDVKFPIGVFTTVTGVSGCGKSTLVMDTLARQIFRILYGLGERPGKHDHIEGVDSIDKMILVDQSPLGKSPRSNPATATGLLDPIRNLFANIPEARMKGFAKGRFSFNVGSGRCPACEGKGYNLIEMHFLSDVWIKCDACKGARYNRETLSVTFKGKNIADVLRMEVDEAVEFFQHQPRIYHIVKTLQDVGLGYIRLGQPGNTLSGGESQRVKLATELAKKSTGKTLYILDEPTTGLHFEDVDRLINVFHKAVDAGNTVVVIEHNLDVIKSSDHVIDLGVEGGDAGGYIVAQGTPEAIAQSKKSWTGKFLKEVLKP